MLSFFPDLLLVTFFLLGLDRAEKDPYKGWKTNNFQADSPENEYVSASNRKIKNLPSKLRLLKHIKAIILLVFTSTMTCYPCARFKFHFLFCFVFVLK